MKTIGITNSTIYQIHVISEDNISPPVPALLGSRYQPWVEFWVTVGNDSAIGNNSKFTQEKKQFENSEINFWCICCKQDAHFWKKKKERENNIYFHSFKLTLIYVMECRINIHILTRGEYVQRRMCSMEKLTTSKWNEPFIESGDLSICATLWRYKIFVGVVEPFIDIFSTHCHT